MKKCSNCLIDKNKIDFYKKSRNKLQSWCKSCTLYLQKCRWRDRKRKAVELLGGKCCKCGYNKNLSALDFHHIDPKRKKHDWKTLRQLSWKSIINELEKCVLLCKNCHAEIHNIEDTVMNTVGIDNASLTNILSPSGKCQCCDSDVYGTLYCSVNCHRLHRRKVKERPSKEELIQLLKNNSYVAIGKKYKVSDNAIRKWAKGYNLI